MKEHVFLSNNKNGIVEDYWIMHCCNATNVLINRVNCSGNTYILILFWRVLRDLRALLGCNVKILPMRAEQGGSLYYFYDGLWYDLAGTWTHDLPYERRTLLPLSNPDMVMYPWLGLWNKSITIYWPLRLWTLAGLRSSPWRRRRCDPP